MKYIFLMIVAMLVALLAACGGMNASYQGTYRCSGSGGGCSQLLNVISNTVDVGTVGGLQTLLGEPRSVEHETSVYTTEESRSTPYGSGTRRRTSVRASTEAEWGCDRDCW